MKDSFFFSVITCLYDLRNILRHIYVKHTNIRHSGSRTDTISEIVSDILASSELVSEITSKDVSIIFFSHKLVY